LVHYETTGKVYADCDTVGKAITKHLKDYCINQGYLRKTNLYKTLKPQLETDAIPNAEFMEDNREAKGNNYPRSEIYKFFLKEKIVKPKKK